MHHVTPVQPAIINLIKPTEKKGPPRNKKKKFALRLKKKQPYFFSSKCVMPNLHSTPTYLYPSLPSTQPTTTSLYFLEVEQNGSDTKPNTLQLGKFLFRKLKKTDKKKVNDFQFMDFNSSTFFCLSLQRQ